MSYLAFDIFTDKEKAMIMQEAYKQANKKVVRMVTVKNITVNDCSSDPCIAKYDQSPDKPLYIVISGDDKDCGL